MCVCVCGGGGGGSSSYSTHTFHIHTHAIQIRIVVLGISRSMTKKKVLLHEHKRHSACHISSAPCYAGGVPSPRSGGVPHPRSRGYPSQVWGAPCPRSRGGTQFQVWGGTPSRPGQRGGTNLRWGTPPDLRWGTPSQTWDGVPLPATRPEILRWGTPLHAIVNRQTFPSINITFPRTTYAGGKNLH